MRILVTGGLGYIGSHTALALQEAHHQVIIADNLSNASASVQGRIEKITGEPLAFYPIDVRDQAALTDLFDREQPQAVIHFAGSKAVGESVREPIKYYQNNVDSTLSLLTVMAAHQVWNLVFSSSATVYSPKNPVPFVEGMPLGTCSPYGWTKIMNEQILADCCQAYPQLTAIILRYFNPIGAHPSGWIGEMPQGVPNNLMPYICQVADGSREQLHVFGNDYPTPDGTCIRDYIHVLDLAQGHVQALQVLADHPGCHIYNLGRGQGISVLGLVHAFERANHLQIPYVIDGRRPGDIPAMEADCQRAREDLGWVSQYSIEEACQSAWTFQQRVRRGEIQ